MLDIGYLESKFSINGSWKKVMCYNGWKHPWSTSCKITNGHLKNVVISGGNGPLINTSMVRAQNYLISSMLYIIIPLLANENVM